MLRTYVRDFLKETFWKGAKKILTLVLALDGATTIGSRFLTEQQRANAPAWVRWLWDWPFWNWSHSTQLLVMLLTLLGFGIYGAYGAYERLRRRLDEIEASKLDAETEGGMLMITNRGQTTLDKIRAKVSYGYDTRRYSRTLLLEPSLNPGEKQRVQLVRQRTEFEIVSGGRSYPANPDEPIELHYSAEDCPERTLRIEKPGDLLK